MNKKLKSLTDDFKKAFGPAYNAPEGEGGGAVAVDPTPENINEEPPEPEPTHLDDSGQVTNSEQNQQNEFTDLDSYIGNESVNPQRRPLKNFDRSGLTKQDIDEMLAVSDGEMFMPPDKVPLDDKKDEKQENDKSVPENKDEKKPEDSKEGKNEEELFDEAGFYAHFDITEEDFSKVPEKLQEKMMDSFNSVSNIDVSGNQQYIDLKTQFEEQQKNVKDFLDDPYVAARLEEIQKGQEYIARELPPASREEIEALKAAETEADFNKLINKMIETRAEQAINNERSVANNKSYTERTMIKASNVFKEVSKLDARLTGNITVENWNEIGPGHPDYKEYVKGPKKIIDYCMEKGLKIDAISKMSPKELYAAIAAKEGWDKQRVSNIEKKVRSDFLKKIRKGMNAPKELSSGRRSSAPMSGRPSTGASRDSLVEQLASGDSRAFDRELAAADGNPEKLNWLQGVQAEAIRKAREARRKR